MPSEVVMRLLRQGFAAQQSGQDALAESCYQKALQHQPDEPDALQLLGLLAKKRGDLSTTEQYLRRSLAARPAQPMSGTTSPTRSGDRAAARKPWCAGSRRCR